jgi:hypothetical protein
MRARRAGVAANVSLPDFVWVGSLKMIDTLKERVNGDEALVRRGRFLTTTCLLEIGRTAWLIAIFEGRIVSVTPGPFVMPSSSFALRASKEEWENSQAAGRRRVRTI